MAAPKTAKLALQQSPALGGIQRGGQAPIPGPATQGRDLVSMADLSPAEFELALTAAELVKANPREYRKALADRQIVLIFEKPSLRTRVTFEAGMKSMGGDAIFLDQRDCRIGEREEVRDVARNLERWVDGIVLRTFEHATVAEMARYARVPVINALSDLEHPCQALADFLTLKEKFSDFSSMKLAYVGDGNNMAHSLLLAAALAGSEVAIATPAGYEPKADIVARARAIAAATGAAIEITHDPMAAVAGADAVYTDVWASMGQEGEAEARKAAFAGYQVTGSLMSCASRRAIFMHCLPAHRGQEVAASVIDSPRSVVFEQAENRLHAQKALLLLVLSDAGLRFPARAAEA
ncbi:MAG: ornithine carbamoyltransferase [Acidobacteria bacterium]|nr:ornithine carbamoyltransferase [Acidobacteriota bacterium]